MLQEIWPLVTLLRWLLLLPVSTGATGLFSFRWMSWPVFFSLAGWLGLVANTILLVYFQYLSLSYASSHQHPLSDLVEIAAGIILLSYVPLIPVCMWREAGFLSDFFNEWRTLEAEYISLGGSPLHLGLRIRAWSVVVTSTVSGVTIVVLARVMTPAVSIILYLPFLHFCLFNMSTVGLWACICQAVCASARALADRLPADIQNLEALRANRLLWVHLDSFLGLLSSGWVRTQQIVFMLVFFEWVVTNFGLLNLVLLGCKNFYQFPFHLMIAFSCGWSLLMSCNSSQSASDAMKTYARDKLLYIPTLSLKQDVLSEVDIFLHHIHERAQESLSVGGYIRVNRGTVLTFLKTTGTYLVVLSQFTLAYSDAYAVYFKQEMASEVVVAGLSSP